MASRSHRKVHMARPWHAGFCAAAISAAFLATTATEAHAQEVVAQEPAQPPGLAPAQAPEASAGGMNSPGAFGVGVVLTGVGAAGLGIGGWLFSKGSGACDSISRESIPSDAEIDACTSGVTNQVAGVLSMVAGGAFALAGIPLIITGAIPADSEEQPAPRIGLYVAPTSARLEVEF